MRSMRNPRGEDAPQVAANGLLDRRALLGRGALLAGAMTAVGENFPALFQR